MKQSFFYTKREEYKMENKTSIAKILKYGSIVLLALGTFGAIAISQTTIASEYSWKSETYFDGGLFFSTVVMVAISCAIIYGLGELIEINHDNREYLAILAKKDEKTDLEKEKE